MTQELLRSRRKNTTLWSWLCCHGNELLVYISRTQWGQPGFACQAKELPSSPATPAPGTEAVWFMRQQKEPHRFGLDGKSCSARRNLETKAGGGPSEELGGKDTLSPGSPTIQVGKPSG